MITIIIVLVYGLEIQRTLCFKNIVSLTKCCEIVIGSFGVLLGVYGFGVFFRCFKKSRRHTKEKRNNVTNVFVNGRPPL